MRLFLYIFEDGTIKQCQHGPTADDMQCVEDGILQVIEISVNRHISNAPISVGMVEPDGNKSIEAVKFNPEEDFFHA